MKTQFLVETLTYDQGNLIQESVVDTEGKNLYLSGCFMQAETKNRNGRIYPITEMQNAVARLTEQIKQTGGVWGELDHPPSLQVASDRVSHVIQELRVEGNNVYGKAKILNTPMGQIAKVLITESGVKPGVSSRGAGEVNEQGIVSGFNLITVDIVGTPSCASAYPTSIYESLDESVKGRRILTLAESVQEDQSAQKYLVTEIKKWLDSSLFVKK
jgi:hypothetical protein